MYKLRVHKPNIGRLSTSTLVAFVCACATIYEFRFEVLSQNLKSVFLPPEASKFKTALCSLLLRIDYGIKLPRVCTLSLSLSF